MISKFFGTLKNVYNFFVLYANNDNVDIDNCFVEPSERPELDRWILSKFNMLVKNTTEYMDSYDHMKTVRVITDFVSEDLSNWYIRRARRRFYADEMDLDKKSVYATTYEILVGISKIIAPFAPFIADELYTKLTGEESVHLAYFPEADMSLVCEQTEERMDLVRTLVTLARGTREKERIKVRQPLSEILVSGQYEALIGDLVDLIKEELNVKEVVFDKELDKYMNFQLKPNFKVAGPELGKHIKSFGKELANLSPKEVSEKLDSDGFIMMELDGENVKIEKDFVDVKIEAKDGFAVAMENNVFTILDTKLSPELIAEGLARELVSKVQQLRKQNDFAMMDRINIYTAPDEEVKSAISKYEDYIKTETLANEIIFEDRGDSFDLNGHKTAICVERV